MAWTWRGRGVDVATISLISSSMASLGKAETVFAVVTSPSVCVGGGACCRTAIIRMLLDCWVLLN